MTSGFVEQRMALRLRLQSHRHVLADRLTPMELLSAPVVEREDRLLADPRSVTMRLLTRHHTLVLILLMEMTPLILRYWLRKSAITL